MRRNDLKSPDARKLAEFRGRWNLTRIIEHAGGQTARFDGQALWRPQGDDLIYEESGLMRVPGQMPMSAVQRHTWHPDLTVCFADGRFFHAVPPEGGPTAHWCAPDQYDGAYDFTDWPRFTVTWRVRGPRKAYVSRSTYMRAAP